MAYRPSRGKRAAAASTIPSARPRSVGRGASLVRALRAHEHRSAALLLAALVLVYLWPALVEGKLLAPLANVYGYHPWTDIRPAGVVRWINGDMGDVPFAYYPWDVLARRFIHSGTFPAWNPYAFAGTPLFANSQIAWLSPFSLPLWILPLNYALGVAAALKLWTAGFGAYLLARELRLGFLPGVVAGTAFALGSFNVVWLSYGIFVSVAAMLPWALWLTERIVRRGRSGDGLALAGVLTVALLGGHPGTQVHLLAGTALYALLRTATVTGVGWRERARRLALLGGGAITALLLAAIILVPAQRAAADTIGALIRQDGAASFRSSQMPADILRTALFPDWWGRPGNGQLSPGPGAYRERTFYAGAATLVLALIALASPGAWRRKAPFAVLGLLGLAIAARAPGLYDVVISLPAFDRIQNTRIYLWFTLAAAVLAAFGLQRVLDARGRLGRAWIAPAAGLLAGLAAALALVAGGGVDGSAVLDAALHRPARGARDALALASVAWWLLPVAALAAALWLARSSHRRGAAAIGIVLLVAVDLLHFADGYQPMGPADKVIPPRTPAIAYLERHRHEGRIAGVQSLTADWSTLYRLHDVRGSDEPAPSLRYHQLMLLADPVRQHHITLDSVSAQGPRVLGLLGVRYVLLTPRTRGASPGLSVVYARRDGKIFKNRFAAPRAFVATSTRVAAGEEQEFEHVADGGFDPRYVAVVRADEVGATSFPPNSGSATVVREDNDSVHLRATLAQPGVVVLGDAWAPGWSVEVDGRPARPLQANVVLRGVAVPAGTHEIAWRYRVPGLRAGAALSAVGLLLVLAWAATLRLRTRARTSRPRSSDPATMAG